MNKYLSLPVNYSALLPHEKRIVREEYIRLQDGNCAHCGSPLSGDPRKDVAALPVKESLFPENFFRWPVHLHHSHKTGLTIGAVHCHCNAVLWQYYGE